MNNGYICLYFLVSVFLQAPKGGFRDPSHFPFFVLPALHQSGVESGTIF